MSEIEKLQITNQECHTLNMIRGLDQDVMYMVIAARQTENGYALEGKQEVFTRLRHDLYDELELKPKSRIIRSLLRKLDEVTEEVW
jgi:hypothetical protein